MSSRRGNAVYRFLSPAGSDQRLALGYAARPMIRNPVRVLPILYADQHPQRSCRRRREVVQRLAHSGRRWSAKAG